MTPNQASRTDRTLATALRGLAAGRIALGAASLVAPRWLGRTLGMRLGPESVYLTRIFGARALALGLGYLTAPEGERRRWQRLALMVDIIDTTHGANHLARGDVPRTAAAPLVALTGSYMAVGAARLARDLR
ncbi:hypothetical protein BJY24_006477 [Nocardia transvalensis]|uniref:Aspartate carbamoyl transferase n=1 Tax=Nocardia transvalensis TaxID=37333 RepID=A0A7W9UMA1_9NOCA|nr:hypothetical protein [Nocardia transvalensis]MBB5917565.1 hypothetical protein [Nocardia transvalensis]